MKRNDNKKRKPSFYRTLVALGCTALVAVGYFTMAGIGNMSAIGWDAWSAICPVGYVESLLAGKVFVPRALISFIAVVALVLVLGRVFCSWICPMPFLQRWIPGKKKGRARDLPAAKEVANGSPAAKKTAANPLATKEPRPTRADGKPRRFALDSRHGVLAGALASAAIFGFPVFCLICPVGLTFATVLLVMRLFAYGEATWTVIVIPAVLLAEVIFARSWCHKFCPLGALISLISGGNKTLRPTIDNEKCLVTSKKKACYTCSAVCPEHLDVRRPAQSAEALCNCTKCRECAFACPGHAISFPFLPKGEADTPAQLPEPAEATGTTTVAAAPEEGSGVQAKQ